MLYYMYGDTQNTGATRSQCSLDISTLTDTVRDTFAIHRLLGGQSRISSSVVGKTKF